MKIECFKIIIYLDSSMIIIDKENALTHVYTCAWKEILSKKTYFCWLDEIVLQIDNQYKELVVLLHPEALYFHSVKMQRAWEKSFTIHDYKKTLQEKLSEISVQYWWEPYVWRWNIQTNQWWHDDVLKDLLGKPWKLEWNWHFYGLRAETVLSFRETWWDNFAKKITRYPQHQSLARFFEKMINRSSFMCLIMRSQKAELWAMREWMLSVFASVPLWTHILMEAATDQWVQKYLLSSWEQKENPLATKLMTEAIGFYRSSVLHWISSYTDPTLPLIICTGIFHPLFFSIGQEMLQSQGVFAIPYSPKQAWYLGTKLSSEHLAVVAYLHEKW